MDKRRDMEHRDDHENGIANEHDPEAIDKRCEVAIDDRGDGEDGRTHDVDDGQDRQDARNHFAKPFHVYVLLASEHVYGRRPYQGIACSHT